MIMDINIDGVSIDEVGIKTDRTEFTDEELNTLVSCVSMSYSVAKWLIADVVRLLQAAAGHKQPGTKGGGHLFDDLVKKLDISPSRLYSLATTACRIPHALRRKNLSFTAHVNIAMRISNAEEIKEWLDKAESENMTSKQLTAAISKQKASATFGSLASSKNKDLKAVTFLWQKYSTVKKLQKAVDDMTYEQVQDALGAFNPCMVLYQKLRERLLYLNNECSGESEAVLDDMISKAADKRAAEEAKSGKTGKKKSK